MQLTPTILITVLLSSTAFTSSVSIPAGLTVPVMTGPNSVMHTKSLPNDNTIHPPYLPWSGTANADVMYGGQKVIKKGDAVGGMWGGRRGGTASMGELFVTVTTVNGQSVIAGRYSQVGPAIGQDTWVSAGAVISFMTCQALNSFGGCTSSALTPNQQACTNSGGTLTQNNTVCNCPSGKIFSNGSGGAVVNGAICLDATTFYKTACTNTGGSWTNSKCACPARRVLNTDGTCQLGKDTTPEPAKISRARRQGEGSYSATHRTDGR